MKRLISLFVFLYLFIFGVIPASAIYDPLSVPNNRVGVHILEPSETTLAAKLVNSSGGDWGYVTIPIRSDDRDYDKWFSFFRSCYQQHLIPIVRIATYVDGSQWVKPTIFDLVDFANFLNQMPWPVKNRYVVIFNEPNHSKEWGGTTSPAEYASLLIEAHDIFKKRSDDYFLISAGMDMAAPSNHTSMEALQYLRLMSKTQPNWVSSVDGFGFHPYPNPGFTASVYSRSKTGITSYRQELKVIQSNKFFKTKPMFFTETGSLNSSGFYLPAMNEIWTDKNIVAITPFVLFAGAGDFQNFSLLDRQMQPTGHYKDIVSVFKPVGSPLISQNLSVQFSNTPTYNSGQKPDKSKNLISRLKEFFVGSPPYMTINNVKLDLDISDNPFSITKGLSGRKSMSENSGMLFIFPRPAFQVFWMKDMNFPLDMIWISGNKVLRIDENIPTPKDTGGVPKKIPSQVLVDKVLEVNAGFSRKNNIHPGDEIVLFNYDSKNSSGY
jgi:uncharacterized membrane protein (UPF0127 family)